MINIVLNTPDDGTRFNQLVSLVPGGSFYSSGGTVIPHRSDPTPFLLTSSFPNTRFAILVNDVVTGFVTTNGSGSADAPIKLPLGDCVIVIQREFSTDSITKIVTTRDYATWLASLGEQLTGIDQSIADTLASYYLDQAKSGDIDLAHGIPLLTPNDSFEELEAYRETLQLMRQSMRQYAGIESGKLGAVAAITQVNPLIFYRYRDGKRWILGYEYLSGANSGLQNLSRQPHSLLTNINGSGNFVAIKSVDNFGNVGAGLLTYYNAYDRFTYYPPPFNTDVLVNGPLMSDVEPFTGAGEYIAPRGRFAARIISNFSTINYVAGKSDTLYINVDDRGTIPVKFQTTAGGIDYATVINAHFRSSALYNTARIVDEPPAAALADTLEIYGVSDSVTDGTGTLTTDGASHIQYQDPSDGTPGPLVLIVPNTKVRLYSDNGAYIDVLLSKSVPASVTDTFTTARKYYDVATLINSDQQFEIDSKNRYKSWGLSKIIIEDGPANFAGDYAGLATRLFGFPRIVSSLYSTVSSGQQYVEVPYSNKITNIPPPFDIVVGYGARAIVSGTMSITPDPDNSTATVVASVPFFKTGDTHISFNSNLIGTAKGSHRILQIVGSSPSTTAKISYGGMVNSDILSGAITQIRVIGVSTNTPSTPLTANVRHTVVAGIHYLEYQGPNEVTYGATVPLTVGLDSNYRVYSSASAYQSTYIDILVNYSALPVGTFIYSLRTGKFESVVGASLTLAVLWSAGEKVRVKDISPNSPTHQRLYLESLTVGAYEIGQGVYLSNDEFPVEFNGSDDTGKLTIDILDPLLNPGADASDSVTISGSKLPDNWLYVGPVSTDIRLSPNKLLDKTALYLVSLTNFKLQISIPLRDNMLGYTFDFKVWLRNNSPTKTNTQSFSLGYDVGYGQVNSSVQTLTIPDSNRWNPYYLSYTIVVPVNALYINLFITKANSGEAGNFYIDMVTLTKKHFTGLFLGDGTIPRNNGIDEFGELFYVWCPDPLNVDERGLLGCKGQFSQLTEPWIKIISIDSNTPVGSGTLTYTTGPARLSWTPPGGTVGSLVAVGTGSYTITGTDIFGVIRSIDVTTIAASMPVASTTIPVTISNPTMVGRIQDSHNAHEQVDAFDVDEIITGNVVNVRGAIDSADWTASTLTNMQVITRTPDRFSYIKPTRINMKEGESLLFTGGPVYVATILIPSTMDATLATLYENGIPIPQDLWNFTAPTSIQGTFTFDPAAVYTIDYEVLIRVETSAIDVLGAGSTATMWFADMVAWNRQISNIATYRDTISVIFDTNFSAVLTKRSDMNKMTSVLTEDTGIAQRIIPTENWRYLDSLTIQINGAEFNPNAIYAFQYNQELLNLERAAMIVTEIREATSSPGLAVATYRTFEPNTPTLGLAWAQMRATIHGITDIRDVRIHSLLVKGLVFPSVGF